MTIEVQAASPAVIQVPVPLGTVSQAFATLHGPDGTALVTELALTVPGSATEALQVSLPGTAHNLGSNVPGEGRILSVRYAYADKPGIWMQAEVIYLVRGEGLILQVNSFQSYPQAVGLALMMEGVENLIAAEPGDRVRALSAAWEAICGLSFTRALDEDRQDRPVHPSYFDRASLRELTAEEFGKLDWRLIRALKRAQIVEAEARLTAGTEPENERLVSKTVGESSESWRPTKPLRLRCARRTYEELTGWVKHGVTLRRGG
jgi:hypothetical protein